MPSFPIVAMSFGASGVNQITPPLAPRYPTAEFRSRSDSFEFLLPLARDASLGRSSSFSSHHSLHISSMASPQDVADKLKESVQHVADKVSEMTTSDSTANANANAASSSAGGPAPNQLLDEVTGEMVSKTELKKRQKQREKEKAKAEKEATRQAPPPPKRKAGGLEEEGLNANVSIAMYIRVRYDCVDWWCLVAIFRNPLPGHQAHEGDAEP